MAFKKVIPVADAIALIRDGDVLATTGYGGNGTPEKLFVTLEERFKETGAPRGRSPQTQRNQTRTTCRYSSDLFIIFLI